MTALSAIVLSVFAFAASNHRCETPRKHIYLEHEEVVADARWIAIARPVVATEAGAATGYTLEVIEYVKGDGSSELFIPSRNFDRPYKDSEAPSPANSYAHADRSFWLRAGGRWMNGEDCRVHPSFKEGGPRYLVFGPKDYNLGYENITTRGDNWLAFVRDQLADEQN